MFSVFVELVALVWQSPPFDDVRLSIAGHLAFG
jgi:hypothetical protein